MRIETVVVKLTPYEKQKIEDDADKMGLKMSAYLRMLALAAVKPPPNKEA